jgi:hypothetical protein
LRRAGVRAFFFAYGDLTSAEMVDSFRKALDRITRAIQREKPPFLRRITLLWRPNETVAGAVPRERRAGEVAKATMHDFSVDPR